MLCKIISGGQTGADRAALDAGMECRFSIDGSCPEGRMAEDGPIDIRYPLNEIKGGYLERTQKNVMDSDATVVFYASSPEGGTEQTLLYCIKKEKPYKLIDIDLVNIDVASDKVVSFIHHHKVRVLNVAGPRMSDCPGIYAYVKRVIKKTIKKSS